jgi:tRNA pseudouridine55 synthase
MSLLEALKPLLASSKVFRELPAEGGQKPSRKRRRGFGTGGVGTPKIGQGGTLDPLADGVLVLGIGSGTKKLADFISCSKVYRTTALLGSSTLSYDSQDPVLQFRSSKHVTREALHDAVESFKGKQEQLPPLFSSVRIDGKRLFDYAREGVDLPRPVERRAIEVHDIALQDWTEAEQHAYKHPEKRCSAEEREIAMRARRLAGLEQGSPAPDDAQAPDSTSEEEEKASAAFTLDMTVSSGTYVRTIVHDLGAKVGSAAHVVRLTRLRQGQWVLPEYKEELDKADGEKVCEAVPWSVLQKAIDAYQASQKSKKAKVDDEKGTKDDVAEPQHDEDGLLEWERMLLAR